MKNLSVSLKVLVCSSFALLLSSCGNSGGGQTSSSTPATTSQTPSGEADEPYTLSIISENDKKGIVSIVAGVGYGGEDITVKATPADKCTFGGWYANNKKVSGELVYTFVMPDSDYSLTAKFWDEKDLWNFAHGVVPFVSDDGLTLTYGLYPQKHVTDSDTIRSLNSIQEVGVNGWYLLDGKYYAKKAASPNKYSFIHTYSDGSSITEGSIDWFRCEPIEWNILTNKDNEALILSKLPLDVHRYGPRYKDKMDGYYANNYLASEIRNWLNTQFYSSAFSFDSSFVLTTEVDNSQASTTKGAGYENPYLCDNTEDKVFLLSYANYAKDNYDYPVDLGACKATDWTLASGCITDAEGHADLLTRSPHHSDSNEIYGITWKGSTPNFFKQPVEYNTAAVCPALRLKIA